MIKYSAKMMVSGTHRSINSYRCNSSFISFQLCVLFHFISFQLIFRSSVYGLLRELTRSNPQRAAAIFGKLSSIHSHVLVPAAWEYRPDRDSRSSTGYVGLRNLGSTCYMNSLLQVLYMNEDIRDYFLKHLRFDAQPGGSMHIDELRNNIAFQLKRIFYALKYSNKKYYAPNEWAYAFKDETGVNPIDVMQQQDAQEFFQLLCERFESNIMMLQQSRQAGTAAGRGLFDIFQYAFGGKLCNQMFKSDPNSSSEQVKKEVREHNEGFVCISLEVKGCKNLEYSLSKFVAGEQIADFAWEENAPRANITKRQCIAEMSDMLVLHLKRFELNFDTFRREKVNDSFEFPLRINMLPYTKEGLEQAEHAELIERMNAQGVRHNLPASVALPHPAEYYEYELTGVVVHTGTSDSGHYYSYIRDADGSGKWYEFNDQEVSNFSPIRLEAECFGGMTTTHEYVQSTQSIYTSEVVNPKSAYMLIYSRVTRVNKLTHLAVPVGGAAVPEDATVCAEMDKIERQVAAENANHKMSLRVLSSPHLEYYTNLVEDMFQQAQLHIPHRKAALHGLHLAEYGLFIAKYLSRSFASTVFSHSCQNLERYADEYLLEFRKLIDSHEDKENIAVGALLPPPPPTDVVASSASAGAGDVALPPPPSYDEATATSGAVSSSMLPPFPHFGLPYNEHLLRAADDGTSASAVLPLSAHEALLAEWRLDFDLIIMGNIFASSEEVRKNSAALFMKAIKMTYLQYGRNAFIATSKVDMMRGLLSTSAMDGGTSARPAHAKDTPAVVHTTATSGHSTVGTAVAVAEVERMDVEGDVAVAVPAEDIINLEGEEMDEDLALAIKLSKGGSVNSPVVSSEVIPIIIDDKNVHATLPLPPAPATDDGCGAATTSKASSIVEAARERGIHAVSASTLQLSAEERMFLLPNFLLDLTTCSRVALAGENWRKVQSFLWLLLEVARLDIEVRRFLLKRELVAQLVDLLLGEQSPLVGQLYKKGSRRHAPSSFVAVGYTQDGSLPYAAKNIPDWTHLVELLSLLVCSSGSMNMIADMGDASHQCLMYKSLFSTLFRQSRYMPATIPMMRHLLFENRLFTDLIAEALFEEFSLCSAEGTAHIFDALETYLSVSDSLQFHRYVAVLGSGSFNILEVMRTASIQQQKERLVCIFISSFCVLVKNVLDVQQKLSGSAQTWAPWMLKFCYQYMNMCSILEASTTDATTAGANDATTQQPMIGPLPAPSLLDEVKASNGSVAEAKKAGGDQSKGKGVKFQDEIAEAAAAAARKGPFLVVYGEDESERCLSWNARAQKSNQLLYDLLTQLGHSPEVLIPADTFTLPSTPPSTTGAASVHPLPLNMQLADGMSDEELALLLQQETLNNDID